MRNVEHLLQEWCYVRSSRSNVYLYIPRHEVKPENLLNLSIYVIGGNETEELDEFCLVRLARGAGIHVSVSVVACLVCHNQVTCELNFLRRSHSISVCVHASRDLQMDCAETQSYRSDRSLL